MDVPHVPTNIRTLVTEILSSPQLRDSLETTVRQLTSMSSISAAASTTTACVLQDSQIPAPSTSLTQSQDPVPIRHEIQRLFPSVRQTRNMTRTSRRPNSRRNDSARMEARTDVFFHKDVILVSANNFGTLKGPAKSRAYETGYAVSDFKINKSWTALDVYQNIQKNFPMINDDPFEILVPIGGRLVIPNLEQNAELNGSAIKRIFGQKTIYIRPFKNLIDSNDSNEEFPIEQEHYDVATNHELENINMDENLNININENIEESTEYLLKNLRTKIVDDKITQFNIYRDDIFNCCIRAIGRKSFNPFQKISVIFTDCDGISEGAVDMGGPTREMFRLVLKYLQESNLFIGQDKKFLRLNMNSLEELEYFHAGRIIALSLLHEGPGPHFFSEELYYAITKGIDSYEASEEFIEEEIKNKIIKINQLDSQELREYVLDEQIFAIAGCSISDNKQKLIKDCLIFYNIFRMRPALEQFIDGLKTAGILQLLCEHSKVFHDVMCGSKTKITCKMIEDIFECQLSEQGSNKRNVENQLRAFWSDFLLDCEEGEASVTLADILIFTTGADTIPPLGFPWRPKIMFKHDNCDIFPTSNTCALELQLPVVHKTYKGFKHHLEFGMANASEFGFA